MKTSTEIESAARLLGPEKAVEAIAKAGFDAWDFSLFAMCRYDWEKRILLPNDHPLAGPDYLAYARRLKRIGLDNGIVCNQSHAPFPSSCPAIRSYLKRAIECTAEAGGAICVIHPDNDKGPEENAEMFRELLPFAKEHGVKIATENMWNWDGANDQAAFAACGTPESFCAHIDAVSDGYFVACLDVGHAEMRGCGTSAVEMIRALGPRLQALHLHDNDKHYDSHQIPYSMKIEFSPVIRALKEIGYRGYFTLEADQFLSAYTADNAKAGIGILSETVRKMADEFDAL